MEENQQAADKLNRPSCQDTGVIQYFVEAGANFPLLGELQDILSEATAEATRIGPLRHNAVETFDEKNTGTNTGSKIPWLDWEIIPGADYCIVDVYMAGGGCTLPGAAKVLMPGQGYEGVAEFVFDVITFSKCSIFNIFIKYRLHYKEGIYIIRLRCYCKVSFKCSTFTLF